jgi:hypothetical protein
LSGELEDVPLAFSLPDEVRQALMQACLTEHKIHNWWLSLEDAGQIWLRCMRCPASLDDIAPGAHSEVDLVHDGVTITRGRHDAPASRVGDAWPVRFQIVVSQGFSGYRYGTQQGSFASGRVQVTVI